MAAETKDETFYMVQMLTKVEGFTGWRDIAAVKVPAGSKRKTIFAAALKASGISPEVGGETLELRALDEKSSASQMVRAKARDPELDFG